MQKLIIPVIIIVLFFSACKKESSTSNTTANKAITGKWRTIQQETKIYTIDGKTLIKDSTYVFADHNIDIGWYEIYNANGTMYVPTLPFRRSQNSNQTYVDTTSALTYKISGSNLTLLGPGDFVEETDVIKQVNSSNLELLSTYDITPDSGWGLDANTIYHYELDVKYIKEQ